MFRSDPMPPLRRPPLSILLGLTLSLPLLGCGELPTDEVAIPAENDTKQQAADRQATDQEREGMTEGSLTL